MTEFKATYFDGRTSKAHPSTVLWDGDLLHVIGQHQDGPRISTSLSECTIVPPLGKGRRTIRLQNGACLETEGLDAVAILEKIHGGNGVMRLVNFLESHWLVVVLCFSGLFAAVWLYTTFAVPYLAEKTAFALPVELSETLSERTLEVLENRFFSPTHLEPGREEELQEHFRKITDDIGTGFNYRLFFRQGGEIGPNAFALPDGMVLMTDELVNLAKDDRELMAILAHEIAHVEKRHGVRSIIQSAGVFLLISALVGDIASITSTAATFPTMLVESGYSREFEREADKAAGAYCARRGWGTKPFREILLRLSEKVPDMKGLSFISTHPLTEDRINFLADMETAQVKR